MTSHARWRTVVFDLDGTLCNTIALILASFQHAHREVLGEELDEEVARGWIGRTLPDIYAPYGERAEALRSSYLGFNLANLERLQTSFDGVQQLLRDLRAAGVVLGVATSKQRGSADRSLAASGLAGLVPVVAAMGETEHHKPHAEPIRHALAQLGADPETAVYIGDAVVDVQAAQAAGISQIAVTWGAGDRTELMLSSPTAVVDSVDELARWLLPES
ncbi:HAD-IA family hydrolase [Luteococcus sp. H138]|uniref:HAD family hydrolase n=1 Tax=unclassified Luteococcus TaxID=2639923 RepID=UPI00313EB0D1